jgi:hypothetical protein
MHALHVLEVCFANSAALSIPSCRRRIALHHDKRLGTNILLTRSFSRSQERLGRYMFKATLSIRSRAQLHA